MSCNVRNTTLTSVKMVPTEVAAWQTSVAENGGSFSANSVGVATNFIKAVKSKTYYSKIKYLLPMLGGNLSASLVPLIDVLGVGKATNYNFVNADFSETTGLQGNGSTKYLDSLIKPSQLGTTNNGGLGYWENNYANNNSWVIGSRIPATFKLFMIAMTTTYENMYWSDGAGAITTATGGGNNNYYAQRSSATSRTLFRNGNSVGSSSVNDTAADASTATIKIMAVDASYLSSGRCAVSYLTDGTLTAPEVTDFHSVIDTYLMSGSGKSLPPEVNIWKSSVTSSGGTLTANSTTIATNFILAIKPTTYYSKIKYLLPMLGGNLSASLVPLIDTLGVGPATSSGFVNADFSETSGLQGNGTSKILNTGINPGQLGASSNGGLGYWENNIDFGGTSVEPMGCYASSGLYRYVLDLRNTFRSFRWGSPTNWATEATATVNGHWYGQRSSATSRELFLNATSKATNTTNDSAPGTNDLKIRLMGSEEGTGALVYWKGRCALSYMTDGTLTAQEVSDFHSALNTYLISATGK